MFTKRELYLLAKAVFEQKTALRTRDKDNRVKMTPEQFDDYLELSQLHLKIKDYINGL